MIRKSVLYIFDNVATLLGMVYTSNTNVFISLLFFILCQ